MRALSRGSGSAPSRSPRSWRPICADQLSAVLHLRHAVVVEGVGPGRGDVGRDGGQRRIGVRRDRPLGVPEVAAAGHRDPPVAPRLLAQPGHRGQAVVLLGRERPELAAGPERAPGRLEEDLEAAPGERSARTAAPTEPRPAVRGADAAPPAAVRLARRPVEVAEQQRRRPASARPRPARPCGRPPTAGGRAPRPRLVRRGGPECSSPQSAPSPADASGGGMWAR